MAIHVRTGQSRRLRSQQHLGGLKVGVARPLAAPTSRGVHTGGAPKAVSARTVVVVGWLAALAVTVGSV